MLSATASMFVPSPAMKKRLFVRRGELPPRAHDVRALEAAIEEQALAFDGTALGIRRLEPLLVLRKKVVELAEPAYAELRAWAEKRRETLPLDPRLVVAFLFDAEPSLAEKDLRLCIANPSRIGPLGLTVARDKHLLEEAGTALLALDAGIVAYLSLEIARTFESAPDEASRIVVAYAEAFDELLREGKIDLDSIDARAVTFGDVLACLGTPISAAHFARRIGSTSGKRFAARFFKRFPALAEEALAPVITGRGRKRDAAEALLADARARTGTPPEPTVGEERPEAPLDLVPAILRDPPWRNWRSANLPIVEVEDLPVLDIPHEATRGLDREKWIERLPSVPRASVFSSRGAFSVAHAWLQKRAERAAAREWLESFAPFAIFGLLPYALGEPGSARTIAVPALRLAWKVGGDEKSLPVVERWAHGAMVRDPFFVKKVRAVLDADPIWDCPDKPPKWPEFLPDGLLPPVLLADREHRLGDRERRHLVELLSFAGSAAGGGDLVPTYRGIDIVKTVLDPESVEELAWTIFRASSARASRITWTMDALVLFAGPSTARNLAQHIRSLVTERAIDRAKEALEVLGRLQTESVLVQLHRIAESGSQAELRERARVLLENTAKERGIAQEELDDLLVTDLGLDPNGTLRIDYGPRSFALAFDAELRPVVKDAEGKISRSLPKPTKKDDPEKSAAAVEAFKGLKRDAEDAIKGQLRRLERSMCSQRRWDHAVFEERLARHPLLRHIAGRLVWAVVLEERLATFRIAEDLSYATEDDEPYALPDGARIALPHPLEVDEELRGTWNERFADYAIFAPFPQMARDVYELHEPDPFARFVGKSAPGTSLFALEHRGWKRPDRWSQIWSKRFGDADVLLGVTGHPGKEDVAIHEVSLVEGKRYVTVNGLSAIQRSEIARDLTRMIEGR